MSRERKKVVVTVIIRTSKKCNFLSFFSEPKHRKLAFVFGIHFKFESLWWDCFKFQCIWIKIHPKLAGSIFVTIGVVRQIWLCSSLTNAKTQIKKTLKTQRRF